MNATKSTIGHCGCGEWLGERCNWTGPMAEMVVVEWMPEYLRSSHEAAGNAGQWPHNGAVRVAVQWECADMVVEASPNWARIVEGADPADYLESV